MNRYQSVGRWPESGIVPVWDVAGMMLHTMLRRVNYSIIFWHIIFKQLISMKSPLCLDHSAMEISCEIRNADVLSVKGEYDLDERG